MTRQWEPGDVALISYEVSDQPSIKYHAQSAIRFGYGWIAVGVNGNYEHVFDRCVTRIRPLVVIDPEDHDALDPFIDAVWGEEDPSNRPATWRVRERIKAALLEPPKPEEPTGLGAVVEDSKGDLWVRHGANSPRCWFISDGSAFPGEWDSIDVVRILSEGVQP